MQQPRGKKGSAADARCWHWAEQMSNEQVVAKQWHVRCRLHHDSTLAFDKSLGFRGKGLGFRDPRARLLGL